MTKPEPKRTYFLWFAAIAVLALEKSRKNSSKGEPLGILGSGTLSIPLKRLRGRYIDHRILQFSTISATERGPLACPLCAQNKAAAAHRKVAKSTMLCFKFNRAVPCQVVAAFIIKFSASKILVVQKRCNRSKHITQQLAHIMAGSSDREAVRPIMQTCSSRTNLAPARQ